MAAVDRIKKLHTAMIDTRRAYEKAHGETESLELKSLFSSMVELRQRHHDELHTVLVEMGETPDDDGSFMTTVHETVIGVRAAIKGVDRDALPSFAKGEENIVKDYDNALEEEDLVPATAALLTKQKTALVEKIEQMASRQSDR